MCGISGIIYKDSFKSIRSIHEIKKMTDFIHHRGPDDEGFLLVNQQEAIPYGGKDTPNSMNQYPYYPSKTILEASQPFSFAFGYRRLSIIDLSEAGHQPMSYDEGNLWIVYNGEVYNYVELKIELEKEGYKFLSKTDTEVILASYHRWGQDCVNHFNGMWSFAIYDKQKQILFCSRDRFGVKPFYYTQITDKFCFGSEIKQFTTISGWDAIANHERMIEFLLYGWLGHSEETFFKGVFQMKGGHNLVYNLVENTYKIQKWYDLASKIIPQNIKFEEASKKFYALFEDAIKLRLRSDVKVGSCLSGGLDSSTIVCVLNNLLKKQGGSSIQETVSSCFEIKQFDEQEFIDEVVKETSVVSHKVFPKFENLFTELDKIVWHQDEPFSSTSIFAQWNVFKAAKENNLIVMLDGQGADEQLAGYGAFFEAYFVNLLSNLDWSKLRSELNYFKSLYRYDFPIGNLIKTIIVKSMPKFLRRIARKYFSTSKPSWLKVDLLDHSIYLKSIREMSYSQILNFSIPQLLRYEDKNSMAFSIESRVPFLDYRIVEFVMSLPPDFLIQDGKTKFVLRESMKGILPEKIINRYDKLGFVTPEVVWMRENKQIFIEKLFEASKSLEKYIDSKELIMAFENDLENTKIGSVYWRIICLNTWHKIFDVKF